MGKLRHEARQGDSLAESPAECRALLLAMHGTTLGVSAFGAVLPRVARVQLHPQHAGG